MVRKFDTGKSVGTKMLNISQDGRYLYYGGESGLTVFRRGDTQSSFKLYKQLKSVSYFALRSTPSGHIVIQLARSNRLKIFDKKLNLVAELNSNYQDEEGGPLITRNPHFSNEGQKLIWFSDRFSVTMLDLRDMQ